MLQLVATDADSGENGRITYALPSTNPDMPQIGGADLFSLSNDGRITTTGAAFQIKRLEQDRFSFTVVARDNADVADRRESKCLKVINFLCIFFISKETPAHPGLYCV